MSESTYTKQYNTVTSCSHMEILESRLIFHWTFILFTSFTLHWRRQTECSCSRARRAATAAWICCRKCNTALTVVSVKETDNVRVWEQCSKQRPVVQCVAALLEQTGVAFRRRGATRSRVRYIQQGQSVSILHHWCESVQWLSWRADVLTFATAALQLYTIQPVAKETETQQPVLAQRFMSVQWDS